MCKAFLVLAWVLILPAADGRQQNTSPLSAKTLYYQADPEDQPSAKHPQPVSTPAKPVAVSKTKTESVEHLGLRYNLLRFDRESHKSAAVDPEHVFEQGDCLQVQLSPNHSGYLYVFDQGSSGKWQVLLPSALMSDEVNTVKAREMVSVPANYCFTVENPSGTEHLFVVLSRSREDMYSLDKAIRGRNQSPVQEASNRLDAEIQRMRTGLGSRDLGVEKIAEPAQAGEPAEATYVVNTSNVSSSRLVTEILIHHR